MLLKSALKWAISQLNESPTPELDARIIIEFILGKNLWEIDSDYNFSNPEFLKFQELIKRRENQEPIAYIVGKKGFYGFEFNVSKDVLIPRPDSEIIVQTAIEIASNLQKPCKIVDLCTGSGALIISVLANVNGAYGVGVDISEKALKVAKINAEKILSSPVKFIMADIKDFEVNADIVISNPPYIPSAEIESLRKNVKDFEPRIALDGGGDGLVFYKILAEKCKKVKFIILEMGAGQSSEICNIFTNEGYKLHSIHKDLSGIERCLVFTY